MTSMPSVMPTVAVASAPRCATKKISTMPKSDSIVISSTIGTANNTMARSMEIAVKSCFEPNKASLSTSNQVCGLVDAEASTGEFKFLSGNYCPIQWDEQRKMKVVGNHARPGTGW